MTRYPDGYKPIVSFDTSAHNRAESGVVTESTLAAIRETRHIRLVAISVEEIFSTPDPAKRQGLFAACASLTDAEEMGSDTLAPPNEVIGRLVLAHHENPWRFDWTKVDVRSREIHDEIRVLDILMNDELSAEQRAGQKNINARYKQGFTKLRPTFEKAFADRNEEHPRTFREALTGFESGNNKFSVTIAKRFYEGIANSKINRAAANEFLSICPPLLASVHSYLLSMYEHAVRDPRKPSERFRAGRNDMYMSAYLPYCDEFVTADTDQAICLREVVKVTGLHTEVLSLEDFIERVNSEGR